MSWVLFNISSSGWWSWMADLFPERTRGTFFLRRSAVLNVVNILWFFGVTIALDVFSATPFLVYAVVFLIGGIAGILDILLHIPIPEPVRKRPPRPFRSVPFFVR